MQNNHYQIYLKSVFDLAASIVIKSHENAKLLNTYIDTYIGPDLYDPNNPRTWKYYLNLCGEYHSTNKRMTVTSMDSLEMIEFNKENLIYHRATAAGYAFGTKQYRELINRYPDQTQLIHGILYPADMDTLIEQDDLTIASYAPQFILPQETQLIPQLKEWVRGYFARVLVPGFLVSDELFLAAMLSDLCDHLVPQILLLRAKAMKTRFAHDYHIHQHLSSHSDLGKYMPLMTPSQAMFAYRNICYIEHHNGKGDNFSWLVDNLLTARDLPLASFESSQNTEKMPDELVPEPLFFKHPLNTTANIDGRDTYTLKELMDLQDRIVPGNYEYRPEIQASNLDAIQFSKHNATKTKVLESTVIDYTDSERTRWSDIALHHWLSLSQKDYYTAFINFEIPSSGENVSISVKDAFPLFVYCLFAGARRDITTLPYVNAMKVVRTPHATRADLKAVTSRVKDEDIEKLYILMPRARRVISIEDFHGLTKELFIAANKQWSEVSREEHLIIRGQKENAASRLWCMEMHHVGDFVGQTYSDWLTRRNLNLTDYSPEELQEIAKIVLAKATGTEFNDSISLKAIQRAMVDMLTDLSSYSIQIGASINTGPVLYAGCLMIRLGDMAGSIGSIHQIEAANIRFSNIKGKEYHVIDLDILEGALEDRVSGHREASTWLELPMLIGDRELKSSDTGIRTPLRLQSGLVGWYANLEPLPSGTRNIPNIPGMAKWLRLTEDQRQARPRVYKVNLS